MNTNNKIIAEFMGIGIYHRNKIPTFVFSENNHRSIEDLHYNSDWNWLMEVVEKISEYRLAYPNEANKVCNLKVVINKNALYDACVEFIKWYNLNK